jgi:hypothetical protein
MNTGTMKAEQLRQRLLAVGRSLPAACEVPYAFEKRIMARLRHAKPLDPWLFWNRILWRCAAPCVVLTLVIGVLAWWGPAEMQTSDTLTADLESVVYAPLLATQEVW